MKREKPNLLIIGASGGLANALLHHLVGYRDLFGKLVLLDRRDDVLRDIYIDHKRLDYEFIQMEVKLPEEKDAFHRVLKEHDIRIALDITDDTSIPFLEACDEAGVSCINTGMNDDHVAIPELIIQAFERKEELNRAPHILCSGMNPGAVNMWVAHGIEKHGKPKQLIEFEYDTSKVATKWHPMMTWSVHEFIGECIDDEGGFVLGRGRDKVRTLPPNALENRESLRSVLEPIMKLHHYPEGMLTPHEECASLAQKYDIPAKYLYSINPHTMKALIRLYEEKGTVTREDLELGDNTNVILDGADSIGMALDYDDKIVYYFNTIPSIAIIGTNATYTQVVIGIFSAFIVLLFDKLEPKVYYPEDLYQTSYRHFLFDNMRVQEFVFQKLPDGTLKPVSFDPMIKTRARSGYEHIYIM